MGTGPPPKYTELNHSNSNSFFIDSRTDSQTPKSQIPLLGTLVLRVGYGLLLHPTLNISPSPRLASPHLQKVTPCRHLCHDSGPVSSDKSQLPCSQRSRLHGSTSSDSGLWELALLPKYSELNHSNSNSFFMDSRTDSQTLKLPNPKCSSSGAGPALPDQSSAVWDPG